MEHEIQQGIEYGEILDIPFIYSCNEEEYFEFDRLTGKSRELKMSDFPMLAEQQRIVERVEKLMDICDILEEKS